ncbi:MAG: hypothetical protein ACFFE2_00390 [Candidatus Thorarchaeota archaeon]
MLAITDVENMKEEPVQLFLSAAQTGVNLASVEFHPYLKDNENLVSSFLTALVFLTDKIFARPLDSVTIGEYTMIMKHESSLLFSYVFKGQTSHAIQSLNEFVRKVVENPVLIECLDKTIATGFVSGITRAIVRHIADKIFVS